MNQKIIDQTLSSLELFHHPEFPFPGWKNNSSSYGLIQQFWLNYIQAILGEPFHSEWVKSQDFADDGNPLVSIQHPLKKIGIRIILDEEEGREHHLYPYLNNLRPTLDESDIVVEVVLLVHTNHDSVRDAYQFLYDHSVALVPPDVLDRKCLEYETKIRS